MGLLMSVMTGSVKLTPAQGRTYLLNKLHQEFIEGKNITNFDEFHRAVLEIVNTINQIVPGSHYDVPSYEDVQEFYKEWDNASVEERKDKVKKFVSEKVKMKKVDGTMMLTGIAAPPAALVAKRAGESMPQLKILKIVPDVLFVPSATILALMGVKFSKTQYGKKKTPA